MYDLLEVLELGAETQAGGRGLAGFMIIKRRKPGTATLKGKQRRKQ